MDDAIAADARAAPGRSEDTQAEDQDGEEEEVADWTQFAKLLQSLKANKRGNASGPTEVPFIPRRGDKDFAPVETSDHRASTQAQALQVSRDAFYSALEAGQQRKHSSKQHNRAVWHPDLRRASMDVQGTHGVHFTTMGQYVPSRLRIELLPEEALYLVERGTLECWTEEDVPLSAQQAFAQMLDSHQMTMARYQVFAYLRRLGFSVHRASQSPSFVNVFQNLLSSLRLIDQRVRYRRLGAYKRRVQLEHNRPLLHCERWRTYNQAFKSLQIVPAGHALYTNKETDDAPAASQYLPFWHVYKPSTKYKKSNLPTPDFSVTVIDTTSTPFPNFDQLNALFASLPDPNPVSTPVQPPSFLTSMTSRLRQAFSLIPSQQGSQTKSRRGSPLPYAKLKNGGPSAIIAAVDSGTLYFLRLNQAEFALHSWV